MYVISIFLLVNKCHIVRTLKMVRGRRWFIQEVCTHKVNIHSLRRILLKLISYRTSDSALLYWMLTIYIFKDANRSRKPDPTVCNLDESLNWGTQNITSVGPEWTGFSTYSRDIVSKTLPIHSSVFFFLAGERVLWGVCVCWSQEV